jgi:hypothetical protein
MTNLMTHKEAQRALDALQGPFTVTFETLAGDTKVYTGTLLEGFNTHKVDVPFQLTDGSIKSFNLNRVVSIESIES